MGSSDAPDQVIMVTMDSGVPPVSIDDVRAHCRAPENGDDDAELLAMTLAAAEFIGLRTGLTLSPRTVVVTMSHWPLGGRINLGVAPVRDVVSIRWTDAAGAEHDMVDFWWRSSATGAVVGLNAGAAIGDLIGHPDAIGIEMDIGFDPDGATDGEARLALPKSLRQAILLLVGHWYGNRETVNIGNITSVLEFTVDALTQAHRIFR